ncbi:hypothetical protein PENTCL1PPCAC_1493, partial [Pristionchus entomophagus]
NLSLPLILSLIFFVINVYKWILRRPKVNKCLNRLRILFTRCSSINQLHLLDLDHENLNVIRDLMGDIPIKELIILTYWCDEETRLKMIELLRRCNLKRLIVSIHPVFSLFAGKFFLKVTENAKEVLIMEQFSESDKIFNRSREFWEKTARELSNGSFSVQVMNGEHASP